MKIGFLIPGTFAVGRPFNGVREQARYQADALEALGHEVVRLDPWRRYDLAAFDLVHFFTGAFPLYRVEARRPDPIRRLVFSPIIDSLEPNWRYRLAVQLGLLHPRLFTIQGTLARQARGSDVVIARSSHERARLVEGLGVDPARVRIVLNGVVPPEPADPEAVRRRLDLPESFLLHVSAYTSPHKNVVRLVEAAAPTGLPLVIAGTASPGPILDRLRALAARHPQVRLLGNVDRPTLNGLYAACRVFCLPSTIEGTGLVALEAASYGAAVVITKRGGPPDYLLDLAEYVEARDVAGIRTAIRRAWEARPSTRLRDHVLGSLTWERSARGLAEAYGAADA